MKLASTDHFDKRLKKRLTKNPQLKSKIGKQLKLLVTNLNHPSLKTHRLKGDRAQEYAIWIEGDLRITFVLMAGAIILTDLITHDEY